VRILVGDLDREALHGVARGSPETSEGVFLTRRAVGIIGVRRDVDDDGEAGAVHSGTSNLENRGEVTVARCDGHLGDEHVGRHTVENVVHGTGSHLEGGLLKGGREETVVLRARRQGLEVDRNHHLVLSGVKETVVDNILEGAVRIARTILSGLEANDRLPAVGHEGRLVNQHTSNHTLASGHHIELSSRRAGHLSDAHSQVSRVDVTAEHIQGLRSRQVGVLNTQVLVEDALASSLLVNGSASSGINISVADGPGQPVGHEGLLLRVGRLVHRRDHNVELLGGSLEGHEGKHHVELTLLLDELVSNLRGGLVDGRDTLRVGILSRNVDGTHGGGPDSVAGIDVGGRVNLSTINKGGTTSGDGLEVNRDSVPAGLREGIQGTREDGVTGGVLGDLGDLRLQIMLTSISSDELNNNGLVLVGVNGSVLSVGALVVGVLDEDGEGTRGRRRALVAHEVRDGREGSAGGVLVERVINRDVDNTTLDISDGSTGGGGDNLGQSRGVGSQTKGSLIELDNLSRANLGSQIRDESLHLRVRLEHISGLTSQVDEHTSGGKGGVGVQNGINSRGHGDTVGVGRVRGNSLNHSLTEGRDAKDGVVSVGGTTVDGDDGTSAHLLFQTSQGEGGKMAVQEGSVDTTRFLTNSHRDRAGGISHGTVDRGTDRSISIVVKDDTETKVGHEGLVGGLDGRGGDEHGEDIVIQQGLFGSVGVAESAINVSGEDDDQVTSTISPSRVFSSGGTLDGQSGLHASVAGEGHLVHQSLQTIDVGGNGQTEDGHVDIAVSVGFSGGRVGTRTIGSERHGGVDVVGGEEVGDFRELSLHSLELRVVATAAREHDLHIPGRVETVGHINLQFDGERLSGGTQDNRGINRGDRITISLSDTTSDGIESEGPGRAQGTIDGTSRATQTASTGGTAPTALSVGSASITVHDGSARVGDGLTADLVTGVSNHTKDIELSTDVTRTNTNLDVGSGAEGHTPFGLTSSGLHVSDDKTRNSTGVGSDSHGADGVDSHSVGGTNDSKITSSGRLSAGTVGQSDVVGNGTVGSISDDVQVLRVLDERGARAGGLNITDISQERVLELPGVGVGERGGSGGNLDINVTIDGEVVTIQVVGEVIVHLSSSTSGQGKRVQSGTLVAILSGISSVAGAAGGVVNTVDDASTSGGTSTARLTNNTHGGRAVGVTSQTDITNAHRVLSLLSSLLVGDVPLREATLAAFGGDFDKRRITSLGRGLSHGGREGDGHRGGGIGVEPATNSLGVTSAHGLVNDGGSARVLIRVDVEVGVVGGIVDDEVAEGSTVHSVGTSRDSHDDTGTDGHRIGARGERRPLNALGINSSSNNLVHPRTADTSVSGLRRGPLNDGVAHAHLDCADHGSSVPAATSRVPSHDLEGSLLGRVDTAQDIEITRLMDGIELVAIDISPVRVSPTSTESPSSEVTTSEHSVREVKDGNVGLLSEGTSSTPSIVSNGLREVVTSNQTSGREGRVSSVELSVSLDSGERQSVTPDGERVNHTVEVRNASVGRVTNEVSVHTLRGKRGGETSAGRQRSSLVNSVDEDLSTGSSSIVDNVHSDVVPVVLDVAKIRRGSQDLTSKTNSKTAAGGDEYLNILAGIILALAEQDQSVLGRGRIMHVGLNFKTQLTSLADEGRGQTDVTRGESG